MTKATRARRLRRRSPRSGRAGPRRAPPVARSEATRARILDAAERLFAERGIDAVSIRSVLAEAGLNVSLVHYHFGGRDGLLDALLRRRLGPIHAERLRRVAEQVGRGDAATLEDVLRAYHEVPPPAWLEAHPHFSRLLGQLQLSPSPRVRRVVHDVVHDGFAPLGAALLARLPPGLAPERAICRLYLVLGLGAFAGMAFPEMNRSVRKHLGAGAALDGETLVDELVRFCAAGLRAPAGGSRDDRADRRQRPRNHGE